MGKVGKRVIPVVLLLGVLMVGCNREEENVEVEPEEEYVQMTVIGKPELVKVEDDRYDVEEIQQRLDEINNGERLDSYKKYFDKEQVLELPKGFELNDSVYTKIDAEDLLEGTHLVYIGREKCPYCTLLRVNLDQVIEQLDFGMDFIDIGDRDNEEVMVVEFGLSAVPQVQVYHEGEVVAEFPKSKMYFEEGVDYESMANGIGDLLNIYLNNKHGLDKEIEEGEG